jgi:hypothetical protein
MFAACSTSNDGADDTATGGNANGGSANGGSATGGNGGSVAAGAGGDDSGHGGKAQGGSGGKVGVAGAGAGGESGAGEGGAGGSLGGAGGSGGDAGAGGSTTPVIGDDTCDAEEITPNDDRNSATSYTLGRPYVACLQNEADVDVYAFQIPADSRGGYVQVSITDVGTDGDVSVSAYAASDAGKFLQSGSNTDGASVYMYFTVKPGASFYLPVTKYLDLKKPNPYTFSVVYHQVPDIYEPNDLRTQAMPIALGSAVEAYMLGGRESSTGIPADDWADFYKVDLAAGDVDILLSITAGDVDGRIVVYDSVGTQVFTAGSNTEGSSVDLKETIATAGTYYVKITPYEAPNTEGTTTTVPAYLRIPYTLTVTQ